MKMTHDIIKNMVRTEKGSDLLTQNKYIFKVDKLANKIEIRNAVENVYNVQVSKVHIMNVKGKKKRVRFHEGMTTGWKKAVVTLKPESRIEVA